jgi:hypothetical protein
MHHWKIARFVKEECIQKLSERRILDDACYLKTLFIELCANSSWPCLGNQNFKLFIHSLDIDGEPLTDS